MSKKNAPQPARPPVALAFERLESHDHADRASAIETMWEFAPDAGAIISGLLRGLKDEDEVLRMNAFKGLFRAFPEAAAELEELLCDWEVATNDPKARLAENGGVIRILAERLAGMAGTTLALWAPPFKQPVSIQEDRMEHAGRWVAWSHDRRHVLAVSDSFSDVMAQAVASGEEDPYVNKMPGISATAAQEQVELIADESPKIVDDVTRVVPDADVWLNTPNVSLGGEKPRDLINTDREMELRYLLRGIIDGITT